MNSSLVASIDRNRAARWPRRCLWACVAGSFVATLCACSASSPHACYGLQVGDRIQLSVIEPYDANSNYTYSTQSNSSCDDGLDLAAGQTLVASVVDLRGDMQCSSGIASFGPVGGWTWQLKDNQNPPPGLLLYGLYTATLGQCTGTVEIQVSADATPFVPPVVGQAPHVVIGRSFVGDATNTACPNVGTVFQGGRSCVGTFVVSAAKL
jgi:hypothetical protein